MQSRRKREQDELFVAGSLYDLVPADHVLRRMNAVLDLSWLHDEVRDVYSQDKGRPSIDPESVLRLMLAGFLEGIVHDRALLRRAQTDLAFRWFMGYRLDEKLPDHSTLTTVRQRWGQERFRRIFERVVLECIRAGLVKGDTVHVDATLIRADVSWESLTTAHVNQVFEANSNDENKDGNDPPDDPPAPRRGRPPKKVPKPKKRSTTDPDASMATSKRNHRLEPTYKQHTAVDDHSGIVVDVAVETGQDSEGKQLLDQIGRIEANTGMAVQVVTADKGYAHGSNYGALEARGIEAVIPPQKPPQRKPGKQRIPSLRFKYDEMHDRVTCPAGKELVNKRRSAKATVHSARLSDCQACPLRERCVSPSATKRSITIVDGYAALVRARRRKRRGWDETLRTHYSRHRWHVEGVHGRAKAQHGLRRAVRRGLDNVRIQAYLTAIAMNLKKLADHKALAPALNALHRFIWRLLGANRRPTLAAAQIRPFRTNA